MEMLDRIILIIHIACGTISLILFWVPVIVKKGSKVHNQVGRLYVIAMAGVIITSLMLSVINVLQGHIIMAAFLSYLALLTGQPLWYAFTIVKHKKMVPLNVVKILKTLKYLLVIFGLILIGWSIALSLKGLSILLLIFGSIGCLSSISGIRMPIHQIATKTNWLYEHVSGMIVSGIAAYTAFFAFGGSQFLANFLPGPLAAIPWILPTVIGVVLIKRYKKTNPKMRTQTNQY